MGDIRISGSGTVSAGEYGTVNISGRGGFEGYVRCETVDISGAADAAEMVEAVCGFKVSGIFGGTSLSAGNLHVSGRINLSESLECMNAQISGGADVNGNVYARERLHVSGKISCGGCMRANEVYVSGSASCGNVEAEIISVSGGLNCGDTVNGGNISISGGGSARNVCGGSILIGGENRGPNLIGKLLGELLSAIDVDATWISRHVHFNVYESIEGDDIRLEYVKCPLVRGARVVIGEGCEIDRVVYTESCETDESAKVKEISRDE